MPMKTMSEFWQELKARKRDWKLTVTRLLGIATGLILSVPNLYDLHHFCGLAPEFQAWYPQWYFPFQIFIIAAGICLIPINLVLLILKR